MKQLFTILLMLLSAASLSAQDLIVKKDGTDVNAKILEINQDNVKYRRADNPEGPVYTVDKAEIILIRYANGENEVFNTAPAAPKGQSVQKPEFYASDPSRIETGMRYGKLKKLYNRDDYEKLDNPRYSPSRAWFNLLLPGLAQYTMNEPGRGTKYLLCTLAGEGMILAGSSMIADGSRYGSEEVFIAGIVTMALGSAMALTFGISSLTNAVKVAKVKSLYADDLNKMATSDYKLSFAPTLSYVMTPEGLKPAFGAGLKLTF